MPSADMPGTAEARQAVGKRFELISVLDGLTQKSVLRSFADNSNMHPARGRPIRIARRNPESAAVVSVVSGEVFEDGGADVVGVGGLEGDAGGG